MFLSNMKPSFALALYGRHGTFGGSRALLRLTAKEILMITHLILEKVSFLEGVLDPNWVDGGPGQPGPIYRTAIADFIVADLVRAISQNVANKEAATRLLVLGRDL